MDHAYCSGGANEGAIGDRQRAALVEIAPPDPKVELFNRNAVDKPAIVADGGRVQAASETSSVRSLPHRSTVIFSQRESVLHFDSRRARLSAESIKRAFINPIQRDHGGKARGARMIDTIATILGSISGIGILICYVLVLIKMFQRGQTVLGI